MKPVTTTMREQRYFLLAGEHCVAKANTSAKLRRYRHADSVADSLDWPDDATVVKLRPLRNDQIRSAESAATVLSRSTGRGAQLLSELRRRAIEAIFAEETAALVEVRPLNQDVALIAEDVFIRGLSDADHAALERRREWQRIRSIEICRMAIVEIVIGGDSPTTIRAWSQGVRDKREAQELDPKEVGVDPALFGGALYPVREVGSLADQWFGIESAEMAASGMDALDSAKSARVSALIAARKGLLDRKVAPDEIEGELRIIEAIATTDAVAGALNVEALSAEVLRSVCAARGVALKDDATDKAARAALRIDIGNIAHPELSASILAIEKSGAAMQYLGFTTSASMWEEIADHADRLNRLGKRVGTSRRSRI